MNEPEMRVVRVPMHDTGLGREAGYRDDAELIEAGKAERAELEHLLTAEALAMFDAAEREATRRALFGA